MHTQRSYLQGIKRGLQRRCPHCGKGPLYSGYLQISPSCSVCGHPIGSYRADDGPAWATILIICHFLAPVFCSDFILNWPVWKIFAMLIPALLLGTFTLLPIMKGLFIGIEWARARE